jgi:hypothetical protein
VTRIPDILPEIGRRYADVSDTLHFIHDALPAAGIPAEAVAARSGCQGKGGRGQPKALSAARILTILTKALSGVAVSRPTVATSEAAA